MRNIEEVRERARFATWLAGEDREAVMGEFVELHRLHTAEPNLNMMPKDILILQSSRVS